MMPLRKFLILAPFWHNPGHVGVYRVDRFVRWLGSRNIPVVVVCAGRADGVADADWGHTITIKDPLNIFGEVNESGEFKKSSRKPNALRRRVAEWVLNPDPSIVWSKRVASHALVQQYMAGVTDVLSTSPPDASHVGAYQLAKKHQKKLIVDMRDGWLDEPLKPLLQRSRFRQWQEGRLERKILRQADKIFVTSDVWRELLENRLPFTHGKTTTLTNAYPDIQVDNTAEADIKKGALQLLHAGRLTGSSNSRKPAHLLRPLLPAIKAMPGRGSLLFLGNLEPADLNDLDQFKPSFEAHAWHLETEGRVSRERMIQIMETMHGLLLLSTSHAAIPSKLFEYLATGKPIFAATPYQSAVWRIGESLQQVFLVDYNSDAPQESTTNFLKACQRNDHFSEIPANFTESTLSEIFFTALNI